MLFVKLCSFKEPLQSPLVMVMHCKLLAGRGNVVEMNLPETCTSAILYLLSVPKASDTGKTTKFSETDCRIFIERFSYGQKM